MSERQPLQRAKNQTKRQGQEKERRASRSQFPTTSCSELVLGPEADHCQRRSVTVAGDVETNESTIEKKREKSQVRHSDEVQPRLEEKVDNFRRLDRMVDR